VGRLNCCLRFDVLFCVSRLFVVDAFVGLLRSFDLFYVDCLVTFTGLFGCLWITVTVDLLFLLLVELIRYVGVVFR